MPTDVSQVPNSSPSQFLIELTLPARDFQTEWKRCNMLANYIAEYVAYQFPQREQAESLISTITNEFLEAVVRLTPEDSELSLRCIQSEEGLQLNAIHRIRTEAVAPYLAFLKSISSDDIDKLYLALLTTRATPIEYFNQLGLMMLAHDFGVHLDTYQDKNSDHIHTKVFIPSQEFSN